MELNSIVWAVVGVGSQTQHFVVSVLPKKPASNTSVALIWDWQRNWNRR